MGVSLFALIALLAGIALVCVTWLRTFDHPSRWLWRTVAVVGALILNGWWIAFAVLAAFRST